MTNPEPPVIPDRSDDDSDRGWGDRPQEGDTHEEWLRRQRPPHHEG